MKVSEMTWRAPVTIDCAATIADAAAQLDEYGVGALIVVDNERPVGVVTDRDIVTRCVAPGMATDSRVDAVMSMGVVGVDRNDDAEEVFATFNQHAIRRVPVIEGDRVVGLVSLDDALVATTGHLSDLARVLAAQIMFPHANDPGPLPVAVD